MNNRKEFTTADVFEHATLIGRDIEHIVGEYGNDVIEDLMPKIIYLLEQLEVFTQECKTNEERIEELNIEKERLLIHTKRDEAIQRQLEEKLFYVESLLSSDSKELQEKIKSLQHENNCLYADLDRRENEIIKLRTAGALPGDVELMVRMKETIDGQRDELRQLNGEVQSQKREVDALQDHVDRLTDINEQLRLSNFKLNAKVKEYNLRDDSDVTPVNHVNNANMSYSKTVNGPNLNVSLSDELASLNETIDSDSTMDDVSTTSDSGITPEAPPKPPRVRKDPNRPRYTLHEMQKVLEERNMFKIKMTALEEELDLIKGNGPKIVQSSYSESNVDQIKKDQSGVRSFMQKFLGK